MVNSTMRNAPYKHPSHDLFSKYGGLSRMFLTVPWVGLQCVIVAFPGHTDYSLTFLQFIPGIGSCITMCFFICV